MNHKNDLSGMISSKMFVLASIFALSMLVFDVSLLIAGLTHV